jgi:hypothetical protein
MILTQLISKGFSLPLYIDLSWQLPKPIPSICTKIQAALPYPSPNSIFFFALFGKPFLFLFISPISQLVKVKNLKELTER